MKTYKHINACKYLHRTIRDKMYRPTEHIAAEFENEPFAHIISTYTDDMRTLLNSATEEIINESDKT